jgi:hypothetical protein
VERPWLREGFRHADLRAWVRAQRGRLLGALITLVRRWIDDGRPEGPVRLGSFEAWSRVVGGVLAIAGVPGFLADRQDESEVADPDEAEWSAFVALWAERHGAAPVDGRAGGGGADVRVGRGRAVDAAGRRGSGPPATSAISCVRSAFRVAFRLRFAGMQVGCG